MKNEGIKARKAIKGQIKFGQISKAAMKFDRPQDRTRTGALRCPCRKRAHSRHA